ncbi:MAG: tRNA (adenine-N1)-methyltransferase [Nanoarchaeota archaeon]
MGEKLIIQEGKSYLVRDTEKDFHTKDGFLTAKQLGSKAGSIVETNKGVSFSLADPQFIDRYQRIKRQPQIIPRKDVALIIAETGLGKDSVVVDAGTGSGALACFLAHIVKKVVSYEIREDFADVAEKNISMLDIKNCTVKRKSIYDGISEKNVDCITLDLPEPWKAVEHAADSLKPGGFLVSYSPTIPQVMDFAQRLSRFYHIKTAELIEREWDVHDRKVRPKSAGIGHSGFLTFARLR